MKGLTLSLSLFTASALAVEIDAGKVLVDNDYADFASSKFNVAFSTQEGSSEYKKDFLNSLPSANNDISSVLKYNPAVNFDTSNRSSTNAASIKPDDISIHGGLFYQNRFALDGMDITNDIEPADGTPFDPLKGPKASSQGVFVNTDVLSNINVLDSFIPAKYGNFSGGVIDANTINAQKEFNSYVKLGFTSSKLTKTILPDCSDNDINQNNCKAVLKNYENDISYNENYAKTWKKYKFNAGFNGYFNDKAAIVFDYASLRTRIKKPGSKSSPARAYKLHNFSDNFLLKAEFFTDNNFKITPSIFYAPSQEEFDNETVKRSRIKIVSDNLLGKVAIDYEDDNLKNQSEIAFSRINYNRKVEDSRQKQFISSNVKNWAKPTAIEGFLHDMKKQNTTLSFKDDFTYYVQEHILNAGFSAELNKVEYISEDAQTFSLPKSLNGGACNDDLCSQDDSFNGKGQFLSKMMSYSGSVRLHNNYYALYLEDEYSYKDFTLRAGLRADYSSLYKNFNIAPRLKLDYEKADSRISLGYARYYARMPYAYKINSMYAPQSQYIRASADAEWKKMPIKNNLIYPLNKLKTPYDDEYAFEYEQNIFDVAKLDLKYVFRDAKREIMTSSAMVLGLSKDPKNNQLYYTNTGKHKNHNIALSLQTSKPLDVFGIKNDFALVFDYNFSKRNLSDYKSNFLETLRASSNIKKYAGKLDTNRVLYNGKIINAADKPVADFHQPFGLRFISQHRFNNFTLSNFIRYESGYAYERKSDYELDENTILKSYELLKQKATIMDDVKLKYQKTIKNKTYYVSMDIENIFNTRRVQSSDGLRFRPGRSFYFEIGAKF